jgi:hypothetical protein
MKLLLDENLPKRLKQDFPDHIVFTVREMKWNGISNGKLLELMLNEKFDALLTFDKTWNINKTLSNTQLRFLF